VSRLLIDGVYAQVPEGAPVVAAPCSSIPHFTTGHALPTPCEDTRPGPPGPVAGAEIVVQQDAAQGEWAVCLPRIGQPQ